MQIYLVTTVTVTSNSLPFFLFLLKKFLFWIRIRILNADPGGKINADPCESGSTALITNQVLISVVDQ